MKKGILTAATALLVALTVAAVLHRRNNHSAEPAPRFERVAEHPPRIDAEQAPPRPTTQLHVAHTATTTAVTRMTRPATRLVAQRDGHVEPLTPPSDKDPEIIARDALIDLPPETPLQRVPPGQLLLKSRYRSSHNGVTHLHFRQHLDGIEVARGDIHINISRDGRVLNASSRAVEALRARIPAAAPRLTAREAAQLLAKELGIDLPEAFAVQDGPHGPDRLTQLSNAGFFRESIPARLQYLVNSAGQIYLTWNLRVEPPDGHHYWNAHVDALDGTVRSRENWVVNETYTAYPIPLIDPAHGASEAVVNPYLDSPGAASPFGWHDTNGIGGAEFTFTRGNNVHAYQDATTINASSGDEPDGGIDLVFDDSVDTNASPATYTDAAVVNLFYWNNILHDVHYAYGFDEAGGNFQANNYGHPGAGGDWVRAEAQDNAGFNNANMLTLPDGQPPRMQMFLGNNVTPFRDGSLDNLVIIHEYGHGVSTRLTGGPAAVNCLIDAQSGGMGEGWSDWWGIVLTAQAGDTANQSRTVGTWLFGQAPNGPGIRSHPYTTNMSINPLTYESISTAVQPHGVGTVWCSMLWDVYWALVDQYGFDDDVYAGSGGNNIAMQLVMDGLKLQPCNPTFVDARDAILLADEVNFGGAHLDRLWAAFARRGLGSDADDDGDAASVSVGNGFVVPGLSFRVVESTPRTDAVLSTAPTSVVVTLSDDIDGTGLAATDLLFGGTMADTATLTASNIIAFGFTTSPVTNQGEQSITIASNAFARLSDAAPMVGWSATIRYDVAPLVVTNTAPATNTTAQLPLTNLVLYFDDAVAPTSIVAGALLPSQGVATEATLVASNVINYLLAQIDQEGALLIRLVAGGVMDQYGNPGEAFVGSWDLDFGTLPYPGAFTPVGGGSTAQASELNATIGSSNDVDVFIINLNSNQVLSATLAPASNMIAALVLRDPFDTTLATSVVAAAGATALIQGARANVTGPHTLRVSSHDGTQGSYHLRILLDAIFENEMITGVSNNTPATAQNLDAVITGSTSEQAVVIGHAAFPGFAPAEAIYSNNFDAGAGSIALDNSFGSGNGLWHPTTGRSQDGLPGHSPSGAVYFGQNENAFGNGDYNTGFAVGGAISLAPVVLPIRDTISLSFNTLLETETFTAWDHAIVDVSTGGSPVVLLDNFGGGLPRDTGGEWNSYAVDLTDYGGLPVTLRFTFDTFDPILNNFEGWYVDDIQIEGASLAADERDLYRLTVPSNRFVTVTLEAQSPGTIRLDLLDTNNVLIATGSRPSPSTRRIENVLIAGGGEVVVAVAGQDIDYSLTVTLVPIPAVLPAFEVIGSIPAMGDELPADPAAVLLNLNQAAWLPSIQSNDLTINGVSSLAVTAGDGDSLSFTLPVLTEGTQVVAVASGSFASVSGPLIEPFVASFVVDRTAPRVATNSILQDEVVDGFFFAVTTRFTEVMAAGSVSVLDFALTAAGSTNTIFPATTDWADANRAFIMRYVVVPDGYYGLTLFSGDGQFEDGVGHDLDGERLAVPAGGVLSGDGVAGGDFQFNFFADRGTVGMPTPFRSLPPIGSLAYDSHTTAFVMPAGDVDAWTFAADPDQHVSFAIEAGSNLQVRARLLGPLSNLLLDVTAACTGCAVVVQAMPIAAGGTHRVEIEGAAGSTGSYGLQILFNGAFELEPFGAGSNDTAAVAEDVNGLVSTLGRTRGEAVTIRGSLPPGDTNDWFSFSLLGGQPLTLALASTGSVALQLFDVAGTTLVANAVAASNVTLVITGHVALVDGDLTARVSGTMESYSLVIARDAGFDIEPNDAAIAAQRLSPALAAFGRIGTASNDVDVYTFNATAGDEIVLETATPGGGPFESRNLLDPVVELYGPGGEPIATNDNGSADGRNALLAHTATTSGAYRVHLRSAGGGSAGDYILRVDAPPPVHLAVVSLYGDAVPAEGRHDIAVGASLNLTVSNTPLFLSGGTGLMACVGWIGSGDVPAEGLGTQTGTLIVSNDSTIVWQWQPVMSGYFQDFETWNVPLGETVFTNDNWDIHDGHIWPFFGAHSPSNAAWLYNTAGFLPDTRVTSPTFSNGLHALIFRARNRNAAALPLDVQLSMTGSTWQSHAALTSASQSAWTEFVVPVETTNATRVRFSKPATAVANVQVGLDDILVVSAFTALSPDRDGDDLPDVWEILHGLNPFDDGSLDPLNGATGDGDMDGADNLHELGAGTDPNDGFSIFALDALAVVGPGGTIEISTRTEPGRRYTIEFADDSLLTVWRTYTNQAEGVGTWLETNTLPAVFTFVDDLGPSTSGGSPAGGHRVYRVRVE